MLTRRVRFAIAALAGVSMLAACVFYWSGPRSRPVVGVDSGNAANGTSAGNPLPTPLPGFKAVDAGITFKMQFLPGEQGENFKVNLYDHGCGVAVGDCDSDGHDDIYFCNQLGPNALFRNKGDGTFEDVTIAAGAVGLADRICVGATFADYDNDGDQDLYVTSTRGGNALLRNKGGAAFEDVTDSAGVALVAHSQNGTFFDADLDGDLDLFVTNTAKWTGDFNPDEGYYVGPSDLFVLAQSPIEHNVFYRNNGDGTFVDVTDEVGLAGKGWAADAAVFDYDQDGRADLFVSCMFGQSQLFRNQEDGTFRDVTADTLRRTAFGAIGAAAFDFDNDSRLDLYVVDMHSDMWMPVDLDPRAIEEGRKYRYWHGPLVEKSPQAADFEREFADAFDIDYPNTLFGNALFKNQGQGRFEEGSERAGLETFWPWGIATGDFDCDGNQDVFLPAGMGYPYFYWPNYLLMNAGDGTFRDESRSRGIDPRPGGELQTPIGGKPATRSSRCAATADFDGDGRLDLIVNNFNDAPYFYRNEFPRQHYVQFRLRGVRSNRDAIGAVVRLHAAGKVLVRQVNPSGGYLSQSSKTLHFGLGDTERIDKAEIHWPGGQVQVLHAPQIDVLHDIVESP